MPAAHELQEPALEPDKAAVPQELTHLVLAVARTLAEVVVAERDLRLVSQVRCKILDRQILARQCQEDQITNELCGDIHHLLLLSRNPFPLGISNHTKMAASTLNEIKKNSKMIRTGQRSFAEFIPHRYSAGLGMTIDYKL